MVDYPPQTMGMALLTLLRHTLPALQWRNTRVLPIVLNKKGNVHPPPSAPRSSPTRRLLCYDEDRHMAKDLHDGFCHID
jgi:hypothetical protein